MKTKWMLAGLIAAGLGFAFVANSQESKPAGAEKAQDGAKEGTEGTDPFDPNAPNAPATKPKQVQVQVEFVEMSHEALTKLLFLAKPTDSDATKLRERVQEMIAKNEAKVLETQIVVAKTGQKATSESIHEFIYPTEYEQPSLPCEPRGNKSTPDPSPTFVPPIPTAYETRNLGSTLEIEPTVSFEDQLMIDLRFVPEFVWHTGNVTWHEGKDVFGTPYKVQMPDIYSLRLNTSLNCINGQYTLAGVLSPKDDKGDVDTSRKVMVFVKCDVLAVK